jgi:hypothetical protein
MTTGSNSTTFCIINEGQRDRERINGERKRGVGGVEWWVVEVIKRMHVICE